MMGFLNIFVVVIVFLPGLSATKGANPPNVTYEVFKSYANNKFMRYNGSVIDFKGKLGDKNTILEVTDLGDRYPAKDSNSSDTIVQIKFQSHKKYLCVSTNGFQLTAETKKDGDRCKFTESHKTNPTTGIYDGNFFQFASLYNECWYIGANKAGEIIKPINVATEPPNIFAVMNKSDVKKANDIAA